MTWRPLGALASGALVLFSCVTCNMGFYCLPFIPLLLGLVGLVSARDAVDEERTKLWSWLGVGAGVAVLVIGALAVIGYFVLIVFLAANMEGY